MNRWILGVVVAALPAAASAANGLRPRTPALFTDAPCMMSAELGTVVHLDYSIPADDTELTPDELTDSRQMQFFAFRSLPFDFKPPTYITQADFDRAEANGDNTKPYTADDILDTATAWPSSSWIAITPADARVPITAAQAAMGIDWDTTGVTPGPWVVAGYTWEPENNLWSFRMGTIKVVDPTDPDAAGPAAFFDAEVDAPPAQAAEDYPVTACVDAPAGATYTASYGILQGVDEPTWVPFVDGATVDGSEVALSFVAPAEAGNQLVKLRLDVTDATGATTAVYSPYPITVLAAVGGDEGVDDDAGGTDGGDASGAEGGDEGCRVAPGRSAPFLALLGLLGLVAAHRRRPLL